MYIFNHTDTLQDILSTLRRLNKMKNFLNEKDKITTFTYKECEEILSEIEKLCNIKILIVLE